MARVRPSRRDLQRDDWSDTTVINSKLTYEVKGGDNGGGDGSIVMNSNIKCGLLTLGKNVYISGIYLQRIKVGYRSVDLLERFVLSQLTHSVTVSHC